VQRPKPPCLRPPHAVARFLTNLSRPHLSLRIALQSADLSRTFTEHASRKDRCPKFRLSKFPYDNTFSLISYNDPTKKTA